MYRTVAYADDRTGKCDECDVTLNSEFLRRPTFHPIRWYHQIKKVSCVAQFDREWKVTKVPRPLLLSCVVLVPEPDSSVLGRNRKLAVTEKVCW